MQTEPKQILIVDDDPSILFILSKRLKSKGYQCHSADSIEAALENLNEYRPDLIILDLGFKKADGTTFLKTMKSWIGQSGKPPNVIVLSGMQSQEIIDYVMDLGASAFLPKPYDANKLLSMVERYIH